MSKKVKQNKDRFAEDLVVAVKEDFKKRQEIRKQIELGWRLSKCFLDGKQDCVIRQNSQIETDENNYYWQNNDSFNHIAPIIDSRLAKLNRVKPSMNVRAKLSNEEDLNAAKLSSKLLASVSSKTNLSKLISDANIWSETYGTVFYRLDWDNEKGMKISENLKEGDVEISILSPFFVYPENLFEEDIEKQPSLIIARAVPCDLVAKIWNVIIASEKLYSPSDYNMSDELENHCMLIEKFELPTNDYPNGRYVVIAGDKLLEMGELPYKNSTNESCGYPIIKQVCLKNAGHFFGVSVLERLIPIQRAYNAIKNRKYEYLNRITAGVYTVEDGSVDTDILVEEGLPPGKILVYRQGSRPPQMMDYGRVPIDFAYEEEKLLNEFILVSGVSEIMRNSQVPTTATSGVALSILIDQDETRLALTAENIRDAIRQLGTQIIRLYKQFSQDMRLISVAGEDNELEVYYFNSSDLSNDDVVFDTENEMLLSPSQKKTFIFELLTSGLLSDDEGRLSAYMKAKILEMLEFNISENGQEIINLQIKQAKKENLRLSKEQVEIKHIDNHDLHIKEHTKYLLSTSLKQTEEERVLEHIKKHKSALMLMGDAESE